MAESDAGRRATGTVSTEEAERLSERFRPSWEDDPAEPPLSAAITRPLPVVSVTAETKARLPDAPATAAPAPPPPNPTLVGISAEPPPQNSAAEELEWDAPLPPPAAETPSSAAQTQRLQAVPIPVDAPAAPAAEPEISIQVDIEELPPASKPSGIGEKYVPKEEGAPPVVLNEDVKAAEMGAQAALEAQHRARRAPTILRMKAAEIPVPAAVPAEEEVPFAPRRSGGAGKLVVLGAVVAALAAGSVIFLRGNGAPVPAAPPTATARATVAADTAAPPPPPAVEPAAPVAEGTTEAARPEPSHSALPNSPLKETHPVAAKTAAAPTKSLPAPKPTSKAGPVAAKPAPKTGVAKGTGKAAIVRDAPF